jgi:hypothetical protein
VIDAVKTMLRFDSPTSRFAGRPFVAARPAWNRDVLKIERRSQWRAPVVMIEACANIAWDPNLQ